MVSEAYKIDWTKSVAVWLYDYDCHTGSVCLSKYLWGYFLNYGSVILHIIFHYVLKKSVVSILNICSYIIAYGDLNTLF